MISKTNLKFFTVLAIALSFLLTSCGGEEKSSEPAKIVDFDLSEKGIPVIVKAPEGAEVKKGMMNASDGERTIVSWEVKKDKFKLEVNFDSDAQGLSAADLVAFHMKNAKEEEGFELVKEEANGFIYKTVTSGDANYSFNYAAVKDGVSVEFAPGFSLSDFTLEEAQLMYDNAKLAQIK